MKQRRKSLTQKSAKIVGRVKEKTPPKLSDSEGLTITAEKTPLEVLDDERRVHIVKARTSVTFRPARIPDSDVSKTVPGFLQAPPVSVLWLDVAGQTEKEAPVTIDTSGIARNLARFGHPTVLARQTSKENPGQWEAIVTTRKRFVLTTDSHLLLLAIGHGVVVDPRDVFSSLLHTASPFRRLTGTGGQSSAK